MTGLPNYPRTRKMIEDKTIVFHSQISLLKLLRFNDYIKLQLYSKALLSDSGTFSKESSILEFKALNIGQAHEHPEAMKESVMMVGLKKERISQGLLVFGQESREKMLIVSDYCMSNILEKVLRLIIS